MNILEVLKGNETFDGYLTEQGVARINKIADDHNAATRAEDFKKFEASVHECVEQIEKNEDRMRELYPDYPYGPYESRADLLEDILGKRRSEL